LNYDFICHFIYTLRVPGRQALLCVLRSRSDSRYWILDAGCWKNGKKKFWNTAIMEEWERSAARDKNETGRSDTGFLTPDAPRKPERGKAWRGVFCEGVRKEGRCE
jgi:hypothetical protein